MRKFSQQQGPGNRQFQALVRSKAIQKQRCDGENVFIWRGGICDLFTPLPRYVAVA